MFDFSQGFPNGAGVPVAAEGQQQQQQLRHDASNGADGGPDGDGDSEGGGASEELAEGDDDGDDDDDQDDSEVEVEGRVAINNDQSYGSARPARDGGSLDRMPPGATATVQHDAADWEEDVDRDAARTPSSSGGWRSDDPAAGGGGVREGGDGRDFTPINREGELGETPDRTFDSMSFRDDDSPLAPSDIMRHVS